MRAKQHPFIKKYILASWFLLVFLLASCSQSSQSCPPQPPADLSGAISFAEDEQLEFQFPLAELGRETEPAAAIFCSGGDSGGPDHKVHAAEDYHLPAGSPVYAFADGEISFSGPMDGYGWLIIIDHPQANLYSLYGHLSPSRWLLKSGTVEKGDLIAYLGDPDENGGSTKNPLRPHLHFGIRAGQRTDYTGNGAWRWMAGWIKPCPADLGWLQPSLIITGQEIPPGGYPEPKGGLFEKWGFELIMSVVYFVAGIFVFVSSIKKKNFLYPIYYGSLTTIAGCILSNKGTRIGYALFSMAGLSFVFASYQYIQSKRRAQTPGEEKKQG